MINQDESALILAAEDFEEADFDSYHLFTPSDEKILRRLIVPGPVLLRGPRGSGKSAYMRKAHHIIKSGSKNIISAYISLRYFPLISSRSSDYISVLVPYVAREISSALSDVGVNAGELIEAKNIEGLNTALGDICLNQGKRLVLLFDDVAHIGREISLAGFFDFFRTISSSLVSCKAGIYPGVTKFGTRFDIYSDATIVEAQRDERSPDFSDFFGKLLEQRRPDFFDKCEHRLRPIIAGLMARSVLGNVRTFNIYTDYIYDQSSSKITVPLLGDSLRWLASTYLYPALEEIQAKLGAYAPMLKIAEEVVPVFFGDCGRRKVNSMLVHRENVQRLGKVFEILEYTGFIAKREASRSLTQSGSGRGARYALSLGPLFEKVPGGTLSYDLIEEFMRVSVLNNDMVEYPVKSFLSDFDFPDPTEDTALEVLDLPIASLRRSALLPYGLTEKMLGALEAHGYRTVGDLAPLSLKQLQQVNDIGKSKSRRVKSAVEQAIWM